MASLTQWTWVWASPRRWWRIGRPGMLQSMGGKELDTTEQLNNNNNIHLNASIQTSAALQSFSHLPRGLTVDDFHYHPSPDKARSSAMWVIFCCCFPVTKSCQTLHSTNDCSMPASSVFHCLLEFAQIHVHAMVRILAKSAPQENLKTWKSRARYFVVRIASIQHRIDSKHVAKVRKRRKGKNRERRRKKSNKNRLLGWLNPSYLSKKSDYFSHVLIEKEKNS